MINREWQTVQVRTYTTGLDEYGQTRKLGYTDRNTDMVVKIYAQTNTSDVRYVDIEKLGLTKDNNITDANTIIIDQQEYLVMYIKPTGRYTEVFMKKA